MIRYILILLFLPVVALAQPAISPLLENPALVKYKGSNAKQVKALGDTLKLPFIEDFSGDQYGYADYRLFTDSNVYVNPDFCIGPPTIGCATFDGLNKNGIPYASYPQTGYQDPTTLAPYEYLTSKPIALDSVTPADSLYFSFLYQMQGHGESPEISDWLALFFYNDSTSQWINVWQVEGSNLDTFKLVMIPITNSQYFSRNFRFQFRRSGALYGMFDQFNVDYIYLNKNRTKNDTTFNDVGFVYKAPSSLRNYQQMPFNQFVLAEYFPKVRLTQTNISDSNKVCSFRYMGDFNGGACDETLLSAQAPLEPVYTNGYNPDAVQTFPTLLNCNFPDPLPTDTAFNMTYIFRSVNGSDMIPRNDTIISHQVFSDYYAYDDGTAEAGFSLSTNGGGSCAVRYALNYADTIRAVHLFFVKGVDNISAFEFYLRIWGPSPADPDKPGPLLYEKRTLFPIYSDSLNEFVTYTVDSVFQMPVGNFFVGWYQPQDYLINLGFDKNTDHHTQTFYKVGNGGWFESVPVGSVMLRPVVGDSIISPLGINEPVTARNTSNIYLYPNPTADVVNIANYADFGPKAVNYSVYTMQGMLVGSGKLNGPQIDVANLSNGLYFVRFDGQKVAATRKLIIAR